MGGGLWKQNAPVCFALVAPETQREEVDVSPGATSNSSEDRDEARQRGGRTLPGSWKREWIEHGLAEEEKGCAGLQPRLTPHRRRS